MVDEPLTKVRVDLPNHWGTNGESLWARALGDNRFQLDNVPFFAYDLNLGDIVEAIAESSELKPDVVRVLERSGHRTMRVRFDDAVARDERLRLLATLQEFNVTYEGASAIFFALDLPPEASEDAVLARLEQWVTEGWAEYETCEARVPGSFDDVPTDKPAE